jgi:hypothetical protein
MSNQIPFGLDSKKNYAALNPTDLETMGKMAANRFMAGEMSLNDAVIKEAREHSGISTHQVRRVVEFANQEAFARVFEKNAGDKNVDFPIADPGYVLHAMNDSAKPGTIQVTPAEYDSAPVKLSHSAVEADLLLAREFGFDLASPGSEKTVLASFDPARPDIIDVFTIKQADHPMMDRLQMLREQSASPDPGNLAEMEQVPIDAKNISSEEEAQKISGGPADAPASPEQYPDIMAPEQAMELQTPPPAGAPEGSEAAAGGQDPGPQVSPASANASDHNDRMLELQREIEFAKKRQELSQIQQKMLEAMAPQPPPLPPGVQPAGTGMPAPMPPDMAAQQGGMPPGGQPEGAVPPGGESGAPQEIPPPFAGPMLAPPGSEMPKTSSALTKQAMTYAKSGRPHADLVIQDLRQATSLDRIKTAAAQRSQYREHRPFGELERTREKVAYLWREAKVSVDTNIALTKEAMDRFVHSVEQHVLGGGNVGEVAHVLQSTPESSSHPHFTDVAVKHAMAALIGRGLDPVKMKAAAVQYEMEKGASARCANPGHPIVEAFQTFCKVAAAQDQLNAALQQLESTKAQVEQTYREALNHVAASAQ